MFFFEVPPQFKHVLRYILYLLYVHSLIHRFHNEREDEDGEGGGAYQSASSIVMRRVCAVADANLMQERTNQRMYLDFLKSKNKP